MAELVSKRYASALFEVALENKNYKEVREEMNFILACLKEEPELYELLKSPLINVVEKKDVISTIFKDELTQEVYNFLRIIIDRGRESYLEDIINIYSTLVDDVENKVDGVAITAIPMEKADLLKLEENLSKSSGKNVQLENQVDPEIIGGVLVKIGDKVIDGTIKSRLALMQEKMRQVIV